MFGRPRCREWTPLATQQLRLRSLIQIVGYNIRPPETSHTIDGFYYSLHATTMSAPFYTSEQILSPHPKWKEIDSDVVQKMSSTNVIVRLWCHLHKTSDNKPQDILVEIWGVYFTGLRLIGTNPALDFNSEKFKLNTLVFQMPGGYFCSYKSLKSDNLPSEPIEKNSYSSSSSNVSSCLKIPVKKTKTISRSLSPQTKDHISSNSPPTFKQSFAKPKEVNLRNRFVDDDNKRIFYELSLDSDVKVLAVSEKSYDSALNSSENLSSSNDLYETYDIPRLRYSEMKFLNSEVRHSYNAKKLQDLHLLQYSIKKLKESVHEIKENIYKKSAMNINRLEENDGQIEININRLRNKQNSSLFSLEQCLNSCDISDNDDLVEKSNSFPSNGQRFSLKLNDLLAYKAKPSPYERSEYQRLTKQLEILRFKKIILADERDSKMANIRKLKEMKSKLLEENQDLGLALLQCYHSLSKTSESERKDIPELALKYTTLKSILHTSRLALIRQLKDIFPLSKVQHQEQPALSWCARFEWMALCACAYVMNAPLRYPIKPFPLTICDTELEQFLLLQGRVSDVVSSRGAALLSRSAAQLAFLIGEDQDFDLVRGLVPAIYALINVSSQSNQSSTQAAIRRGRSVIKNERVSARPFNRFKESCIDLSRSQTSSCTTSIISRNTDSLIISPAQLLGSEPYMACKTSEIPLKSHGSDPNLNVLLADNSQNKVVFTLGDGEVLRNMNTKCMSESNIDEDSECMEKV